MADSFNLYDADESDPYAGAMTSAAVGTSSGRVRPHARGSDDSSRRRRRPPLRAAANEEDVDAMDVDEPHERPRGNGVASVRSGENDIQRLLRAWQNERHAPDILPASDELLTRVLDRIRQQTNIVNTLKSADVPLSDEDHYCTTLVQTEVERVKFIVRSYLRTRLYKIEQFSAYVTTTPEIHPRLTQAELRHAQRYAKLVVSQFDTTVLAHLPEPQRALDEEASPLGIPGMIGKPDKNKPVFFRALETIEHLMLDAETSISVPKESIILVPYRSIEQHVLRGEVELI